MILPSTQLAAMESEDDLKVPYNYLPREYQKPAWDAHEIGTKGTPVANDEGRIIRNDYSGHRMVLVWHRRAGKDLFCINRIACCMVQRPGLYWHMFPTYAQGRKIAWNGFTKSGRRFLDHFPQAYFPGKNDQEMRVECVNGALYQVVGSDEPDRLVGSNPVGIVFSEWSLCDPIVWEFIRPILVENDGWAIFIFTPRGRNHGFDIYQRGLRSMQDTPERWFTQMLKADQTLAVSPEAIEQERKEGMPDEMINQEYYCSFDAPLTGSYYGKIVEELYNKSRITDVSYDPRFDVNTAWDLGVSDSTVIWFYQQIGMDIRLIDYHEASGEGLSYYADVLDKKGYKYGTHIAPHDITVRDRGNAQTLWDTARKLGIRFRIARKLKLHDGIQAVRNVLPRCWIDEKRCAKGIRALKEYQKEWDSSRGDFKSHPEHDWTSHAADALRTLAVGFVEKKEVDMRQQTYAIDAYSLNPQN